MKRLFVIVLFCLYSSLSVGQLKVGGGLMYSSFVEQPGIQLHGEVPVTDNIHVAPDLIFYLTNKIEILGTETSTSVWEFNGNIHYYLVETGVGVYLVGGINMTSVKVKSDVLGTPITISDSEFGLNVGGGLNFAKLFFAEAKYIIGNADGLIFGGGLRIGI